MRKISHSPHALARKICLHMCLITSVRARISGLFWIGVFSAANLMAATSPVHAKDRIAGPIPAVIERVVDGDTVKVRARIWIEQEIEVSVRIADIDAPELFRPKCPREKMRARQAQDFVSAFFANGTAFLHDVENGKYAGRVVARLTNSDGEDLGTALVAQNHAVAAKRGAWCD